MSALAFELPTALQASAPAEARGLARDGVRLLVADAGGAQISHARFYELPAFLAAGDLLVINVSATLAAAVNGRRRDGAAVRVHFATRAPELDARWRVVELRSSDGASPARGRAGETIELGGAGEELELVAPYASGSRLMLAQWHGEGAVEDLLGRCGRPIRYGYVEHEWPLSAYQNVYATVPGSAEMPSAGRPFTPELITSLIAGGVQIAPITLHTGVSSPERHEPPFPEQYEVPASTARLVNATHRAGGRVIAVGTTVVRALESAARPDGSVTAAAGWTGLVIDSVRGVRTVDGLITGWHEPQASHLQMLAAIAGQELLERSYRSALAAGYLWHEFGDSHLVLSQRPDTCSSLASIPSSNPTLRGERPDSSSTAPPGQYGCGGEARSTSTGS
jgi:S-adenosylmethionine:tRNA ribosyltransferase-isomerase